LAAWLDQQVADIVLNRGRLSVPPEAFEHLAKRAGPDGAPTS
jgi:hypothetical protein